MNKQTEEALRMAQTYLRNKVMRVLPYDIELGELLKTIYKALESQESEQELAQQQPTSDEVKAALLFALYHHQGSHSKIGQPIRHALGIGRFDPLTQEQSAIAMRVESLLNSQESAQYPVAWLENGNVNWIKYPDDQSKSIPLYTKPTKPLSDDEIFEICLYDGELFEEAFYRGARAIEQAHGIGFKDDN